jgi:hypothetical protein
VSVAAPRFITAAVRQSSAYNHAEFDLRRQTVAASREINPVARPTLFLIPVLAALGVLPTLVSGQSAGRNAHRGFDGIWNSATATPLERPRELKDKPVFTAVEAAEWERQSAQNNEERPPDPAGRSTGTGTYNTFYREYGARTVKTLRTSIVTDPPDGRIPALTPEAAEIKRRRLERLKSPDGPEDLGLQDQCLAFLTAGPPMLPYSYNSNYQIMQTRDAVVVHAEMIHDARIIHVDGRAHLPQNIRRWMGDSTGQWNGDTLVVDSTNFNDGGGFYGDAGGNFGWDRNLHLVERLSLLDADTLLYQFEVDDPTAFTRSWKGELTMGRSLGPIYEYACHEGNYSLTNLLRGYRAAERQPAAAPPRR